jgi:hypothetical protein
VQLSRIITFSEAVEADSSGFLERADYFEADMRQYREEIAGEFKI